MSKSDTPTENGETILRANRDFDTGLRLGIASALGQTGFNAADSDDNPRRNFYEVFGWPRDDLDGWDDEAWLALYLRNGYAKTVNDKPALTSWRDNPEIDDTPEQEENSEFQNAIERANRNKNLWSYCSRVDRIAGIGQHGLLVLGLSDVQGENTQDVWNTDARDVDYTDGLDDLVKLKPVLQTQIDNIEWGGPEDGERWGKPVSYTIDFSDDIDEETENDQPSRTVHWSRVIDVPSTRLLDDETLARPRAEPVLNNLLDIEKTLGAVAEAAFMSANSDLWLNFDPERVDLSQGADEIRDELTRYFEGQPFIRTQGGEVEQLSGEVQDPTGIIEPNLDEISAATGIPKKELRGNESGEVSGAEADERSWFGVVAERREQYNSPHIVRTVIDRLVSLSLIPTPNGGTYKVDWPDLKQLSEADLADIQQVRTGAIGNLAQVAPDVARDLATSEYIKTGNIPEREETEPMEPLPESEMQAQFERSLVDNQDVDLTPPESAQNNAQKVLDWRDDSDKSVQGMSETGWNRARQLASGESLSPQDIQEIFAWFARHGPEEGELNSEDMDPWEDNGRVAILGWGGETMRDWVQGKRQRLTELGELPPVSDNLSLEFHANATRYSEGDTVSTPQGVGVVVDIITEDQPDAEIEATSDSPTYAVLVEDGRVGVGFYKASEIKMTDGIQTDIENPEEDLAEIAANSRFEEFLDVMRGNQRGFFNWPESWNKSSTPARIIALKAWANMGGSVDGCIREMRGNVRRPGAFCADLADRLYGTDFWRGDSWAPGS